MVKARIACPVPTNSGGCRLLNREMRHLRVAVFGTTIKPRDVAFARRDLRSLHRAARAMAQGAAIRHARGSHAGEVAP